MKTNIRNPLKPRIPMPSEQFNLYGHLVLGILTMLLLEACQQHTPVVAPDKPTTTPPGNSTAAQPDDSVSVHKKLTISWSTDDFQQILYDAQDLPVQYTSQYINNLGTAQVQRLVYTFHYTTEKKVDQVEITGQLGSTLIKYYYDGERISRTNEYNMGGRLLSAMTYQYTASNQLSQVDERRDRGTVRRSTYQYDASGNLRVLSLYEKDPAQDTYLLGNTIHYSDYDSQREVENLLFHTPMLPGVRFRTNNHRLKIIQDASGRELSRERFSYIYNQKGYPTQQVRTGPGGTLTASYTY